MPGIEERLDQLEAAVADMDARISKLESAGTSPALLHLRASEAALASMLARQEQDAAPPESAKKKRG